DDVVVPAISIRVVPLTVQIPSPLSQSIVPIFSSLNSFGASPATQHQSPLQLHVIPTDTSSQSSEIPSNTLPTEGGNQMVDFEQFGPLSD
ncbi:hypothetical protein HAX54_048019, partial [Datura stramonium]|nr:hypothetical protein [Datura stramonium]